MEPVGGIEPQGTFLQGKRSATEHLPASEAFWEQVPQPCSGVRSACADDTIPAAACVPHPGFEPGTLSLEGSAVLPHVRLDGAGSAIQQRIIPHGASVGNRTLENLLTR